MYRVEVVNKGGMSFRARSGDYEFEIDAKGGAISPSAVLLASLGSCIGVYIRKYADGAGILLKEFEVIAKAAFSDERPFCFRKIDVIIDLKDVKLEEKREKAIIEFVKNCPIHNTLKTGSAVEVRMVRET